MKKKVAALVILVCFLTLVMTLYSRARKSAKVVIDGRSFSAELVVTPAEQQRGLGGRDNLCQDCAMLFKFEKKGDYAFWMKDMRFDLDILWIADGKIVYIAKNVSYEALNTIDPKIAADDVLEANAGLADRYGFKTGDAVGIK